MAKLIIGSPETAEKETEVRFWLDYAGGGDIHLLANAGGSDQILLSIDGYGNVITPRLGCSKLIEFFNGNARPLTNQ